ncbi:tocopherol cyclase family protein [Acetobacterium wieringae]|uniref:tocopherol cyclase family protein n=1 Tax=Acetobacterium wieringae TaxID=52694 RepID=UPI002B1F9A3B|nr:tocopherol cyclase family protein [Acetobacterium wieringae]MEA4807071.1 tocopherol cyclase family protein [Acetobacterium wieringae]
MIKQAYFQGKNKKRRYFEGWYFKCISADRKHAIAIIPGMAIDPQGNRQAFIQVINAVTGKTWYHHFSYPEFNARTDRFDVEIENNSFNAQGLSLNVDTAEGSIKGRLTFHNSHPFPKGLKHPGIMGPFGLVPFMECYHAIIHLYHEIKGEIDLDGELMDFNGGVGYIEKDYGRSFPKTYLWLQASHFEAGDASFVFSRANIPFLGMEFPGFFAYFTDFSGITRRFATYNFSRLEKWEVDTTKGTCAGELEGPNGALAFKAQMASGGRLRAPVDGLMDREIVESITAKVWLRLTNNQGNIIFESISSEAGMEICLEEGVAVKQESE